MPAGTSSGPHDAITASRFSLTVDGVEIAAFSELVGIATEAGPDDLAEKVLRKLPGKRVPPTVTLKRGMTRDMQIAAWQEAALAARPGEGRKSATLTMFATDGTPVARYQLENAWPSKVEISAAGAGAGHVLFETVTLSCDAARRVAP
jgi:phage tail-like protein